MHVEIQLKWSVDGVSVGILEIYTAISVLKYPAEVQYRYRSQKLHVGRRVIMPSKLPQKDAICSRNQQPNCGRIQGNGQGGQEKIVENLSSEESPVSNNHK